MPHFCTVSSEFHLMHLLDNRNQFITGLFCIVFEFACQAETTGGSLSPEQQAKCQSTVQPYMPYSSSEQNYLYISTATNMVSAGDSLALTLTIKTAELAHREFITHLTYLVRRVHHTAKKKSLETALNLKSLFFTQQVGKKCATGME